MLWSQEAPTEPDNGHLQSVAVDEKHSGNTVQIIQLDNAPPPQYMGSERDKEDMLMLGRQQVLRRNFKFTSILGFSTILICTWELLFANLLFALTDGGLGWLLAMGWQGSVVGLSFAAGTIIEGLIILNNDSYKAHQWHGTLLVIGVVAFAIIFNTTLAKRLPLIENMLLFVHALGLFAVIIPLLVMGKKNSGKEALLQFTNAGNWSTMGTAVMIGLLTPLGSMMGFDCMVHMAEEVNDASRTLPKALFWGVALNAVLGYLAIFTLCFTINDPEAILSGKTGYPFIQLFYNVTKSHAGTNVMVAIIIITLVAAVIAEIATASRQVWSFARDKGFPFSPFLRKVSRNTFIPLNAVWVSFAFGVLISLLNLGSTVALNAIVSLTISSLISSYMVSIGCIFVKRLRGYPLPHAQFSLGRWGLPINLAALVFLAAFFIFCFFPTATPVMPQSMNWNISMFGGITIFSTVYYVLYGRFHYTPPIQIQNRKL
ncbi:MAG: hypothetical protein Q9191_006981 [Dirinaria sp. TL-2023a]